MTVKEAARIAPEPSSRPTAKITGSSSMAKAVPAGNDRPILSITSPKVLALFGTLLTVLAGGFLFVLVHIWEGIDRHLEKIDGQLAGLNVTQGKFEQFLTSELPGITQDLKRNTDLMIKLESNVTILTQSVSQVQKQVSIATEEIEKLKDMPIRKGSLIAPDGPDVARPTVTAR